MLNTILNFFVKSPILKPDDLELFSNAKILNPTETFNLYIALVEVYIKILDTLFTNYDLHEGITISIEDNFDNLFQQLTNLMVTIEDRKDLERFHSFIHSLSNQKLHSDHDYRAYIGESLRPLYLDEAESIKNNKYYSPNVGYPDRYKPLILNLERELEVHKLKIDKLNALLRGEEIKNDVFAKIEYDEWVGKIILYFDGRKYIVHKLTLESMLELTFRYLYLHPNKNIALNELGSNIKGFNLDIHKFLDKIGFSGELKTLFFRANKTNITFQNNVTYAQAKTRCNINILHSELQKLSRLD